MKKTKKNCHRDDQTEVEVQALFLDYDGTISPLNVPLSESKVSSKNMVILKQISRKMHVAVITTKDLSFVVKRTPFAHAWSSLGGLETKIGDTVTEESCLKKTVPYLAEALEYAKRLSNDYLTIEEKKAQGGTTVAFSVDWRQAKDKKKAVARAMRILSHCRKLPLATIKYEGEPFFDVFPCPISKGKALIELKKRLGLHGGILYMGDSSVDNSAFEAADIPVCVVHQETPADLVCDYFVRFEDVSTFLQSLSENNFRFTLGLRKVLHRTEALRYIRRRKLA